MKFVKNPEDLSPVKERSNQDALYVPFRGGCIVTQDGEVLMMATESAILDAPFTPTLPNLEGVARRYVDSLLGAKNNADNELSQLEWKERIECRKLILQLWLEKRNE